MAERFEDLGIAPELVAGAHDMGWAAPSPLQAAATPVLRRGNNAVLHAASGSGVTGAWALPVLDRIAAAESADRPLCIALAPSADEASATASALARLGAPRGVTVRALVPGWAERSAHLLIATPAAALAAVRDSTLKLDPVAILVVIGADRIHQLGELDALRTLTESTPAADQKIIVTGAFDPPVAEFIDRHVRKALTIPPRPVEELPPPAGSVRYAVAADAAKVDALVSLIPEAGDGEVAVVCRSAGRAERIADELAARGLATEGAGSGGSEEGRPGDPRVLVLPVAEADRRSTRATVISCDAPFDADSLGELHAAGGTVLVTPAEVAHLRLIAARAGLRLQPRPLPVAGAGDAAEAARAAIRTALEETDLAAYLALIQPLLDEYPPAEVAAAALFLARAAGTLPGSPGAGGQPTAGPTQGARAAGAGAPPPSTAFVRLFVSVGSRDGLTPGDLVGAITGEAGVPGDTVGRIDIRESHSTVEVDSTDADRVIQALNGRTLKGRSLRVDYDRKDRSGAAPRPPRGGSPSRGGSGGARPGGGPDRGGGGRGAPRGGPRGGGPRPRGGRPERGRRES